MPAHEQHSTDLTRHTLSGLRWMYLGTTVSGVLQFGITAAFARLLTPAAFGLIAFAGVFLRFVNYFAKAGITQALVQKQRLSTDDIRAAFVLSAVLGIGFSAIVLAAAPIAGAIGRNPDLIPVLRWLTLSLVLGGLGAPSTALLRRNLRFKELAVLDVASYLIGYVVVGLALAVAGAGVYALVGATLTQALVAAVGHYVLVRHPLLPTTSRSSYRAILQFGSRVSVVGFLEFLRSNLDTLALGRFAGAAQLGFYNRANMLADLPAYNLTKGLSQVLFPSFSAIQSDQRRLRGAYLSAVGMTSAIILPLNAGMAVAGREIVLVLLGPQWTDSIHVIPWLLLASGVALVGSSAGVVAEAQAALNAKMVVAATSALTLGLLLLLARGGPLAGYGAALAASALVSHIGYVRILTRTLNTSFRSLIQPYGPATLGAGLVAGSIAVCRFLMLQADVVTGVVLLVEVLVGALALACAIRFGPLRVFRADIAERLRDAGAVAGDSVAHRFLRWSVGMPPI